MTYTVSSGTLNRNRPIPYHTITGVYSSNITTVNYRNYYSFYYSNITTVYFSENPIVFYSI